MMDGARMGVWLSEEDWKRVLKRDLDWQGFELEARLCETVRSTATMPDCTSMPVGGVTAAACSQCPAWCAQNLTTPHTGLPK